MQSYVFDIAHLLAGGLVLVSFMMIYEDRLYGLLNVFALHAVVLSGSVAWQAYTQGGYWRLDGQCHAPVGVDYTLSMGN
jgi:hydrogenase-4 component E